MGNHHDDRAHGIDHGLEHVGERVQEVFGIFRVGHGSLSFVLCGWAFYPVKFPAYGKALWERRRHGDRSLVACLLVGNVWMTPAWLSRAVPRVAVKTQRWDEGHIEAVQPGVSTSALDAWKAARDTRAKRGYEWRVLQRMTVLAVDVRAPEEVEAGPDGWDAWFWLLADVRRYAHEILMFTPTIDFQDPPSRYAPERNLDTFAWLSRTFDAEVGDYRWPVWWPYADAAAGAIA